jgi:hypothetical protein
MLDYHINLIFRAPFLDTAPRLRDTMNLLQNVGSPWFYLIEIALDYGAGLPYIPQYRKTNAVGGCDESAQSVMQDPLCARALPYQIRQGEER